jgi:8-hydroxy-5-deazaflavin:NADPH oxidoreductase
MEIAIIGTGKMARAISRRLLDGGNLVTLVGRTQGKADMLATELQGTGVGRITAARDGAITGEVVILAVPYTAVDSILREYHGKLAGKIVVDITNPINYQTMEPAYPRSSGAEEFARQLPQDIPMIKAFNTTFASTLLDGKVDGMPLDVFIAGDDAGAKAKVAKLIQAGGLRAIDAGPLGARQLEALGLLHIALQSKFNNGMRTAIKLLP